MYQLTNMLEDSSILKVYNSAMEYGKATTADRMRTACNVHAEMEKLISLLP